MESLSKISAAVLGPLLAMTAGPLWAGPCSDAILATQMSPAESAQAKVFPIVCNWNYIAALERKMVALGDAHDFRTMKQYHDPIAPDFVRNAQRRVDLPETGVVDFELFVAYMTGH